MVMFTPTHGPFFLMDLVGLDVVYDIEMSYYNESKDPKDYPPKALKEKIERKELGVKDGDFIMHLQNNSLEWLITYYGILKTGAVVVPLNFRFVGPDILYAADVCNPKLFILGSEFVPVVQPVQKDLKRLLSYHAVSQVGYMVLGIGTAVPVGIAQSRRNCWRRLRRWCGRCRPPSPGQIA
jgi:hypothetical protein